MTSGHQRRRLLVLAALLLLLSLACNAIQPATEEPTPVPPTATAQPVEPPPTKVPPTEASPTGTPAPTPEPAPRGSTIEIINESDKEIWYLFISPTDAEEWGQDRLGSETIFPGERYVVEGISKGVYDLQARDADDNVIQTLWDWEIAGDTAWNVTSEVTLEVFNSSEGPITYLYVSPSNSDTWGTDVLGEDIIPAGESYVVMGVEPGIYDVRAEDAEEGLIEALYNLDLAGTFALTIFGKSALPGNAVLRFEDDFTDNRNDWGGSDNEEAAYYVPTNGEYCIEIKVEQMTAWEWYETFRPDQFVAEVACQVPDDTDTTCGLGFGPDGDNLYWFEVSPEDQTFALWLLKDDEWQDALVDWTLSNNIAPEGWNYLSLQRVNGVLSIFINGIWQTDAPGDEFPTGRIGLGGSTYEESNSTICMDNLSVWRLE
ncbi:MAG: hypothetical protein ACP5JG_08700 [Anaerolineae bacterium]